MNKQMTGKIAYLAGANAENQVAADYARRGHRLAARRWRGKAGEIDLIFSDGAESFSLKLKRHTIFQLRHGAFHRVNNNGSVSPQKNI